MSNRKHAGLAYLNELTQWRGTKDFNLDKISAVMKRLGDPQDRPRCVHITGTNGKGSVSAAIAAVLGATGASVGLNISPHLTYLNERVVIDGVPASDEQLAEAALRVKDASENINVQLSFHEGITAVAFLCFEGLDWSVLEVGLGGRLDASNVIARPEVAAIVTIDLDHEHILGNTRAEIAREKAGIVKRDSIVVTGPLGDDALAVVEDVCRQQGAVLHAYGRDFNVKPVEGCGSLLTYEYSSRKYGALRYSPALRGRHQGQNMAVVVAIAKLLGISDLDCQRGIGQVFWPGRLEELTVAGRRVLLDCAHNPAGIQVLIDFLGMQKLAPIPIGFGVLQTKNWQAMVDLLIPWVGEWHLLRPDSHLAIEPEEVQSYLAQKDIPARSYGARYESFLEEQLMADRNSGHPLLLAGSMYLIGRLRGLLVRERPAIWRRGGK